MAARVMTSLALQAAREVQGWSQEPKKRAGNRVGRRVVNRVGTRAGIGILTESGAHEVRRILSR